MNVAGIMSGTSCDGLDVAVCTFYTENEQIKYALLSANTFSFHPELLAMLRSAHQLSGLELVHADHTLSKYIASCINAINQQVDVISSHGHTIFHQPDKGITHQIGHGGTIAALTNKPVVCDFRTTDVALDGQGAPLVPIGDEILFSEYDACLNLGGICNISLKQQGTRKAWDITFCNLVLNYLAEREGKAYDENGNMAAQGILVPELLDRLVFMDYYTLPPPKSLGREWIDQEILPIIDSYKQSTNNLLRTCCHHIALQIAEVVKTYQVKRMLITGGGAFNKTLIDEINRCTQIDNVIPDHHLVSFKEAIIFGLLGYLRWHDNINVWSCVTGSKRDSCSGAIYMP